MTKRDWMLIKLVRRTGRKVKKVISQDVHASWPP